MEHQTAFETNQEERAWFGARRAEISDSSFDGEEALMQCTELTVADSAFTAPRPLWHLSDAVLSGVSFAPGAVAPLCHGKNLTIKTCCINAAGALADSESITVDASSVDSADFGSRCGRITLTDTVLTGDRALADAADINAINLELTGFGAMARANGGNIDFSTLAGDELLYAAQNITISDTVIDGARFGWYSSGLTLNHCIISGTRPFFRAKNLTLVDCVLDESCTGAFEWSEVQATLRGKAPVIKNPAHGHITADAFGEVIFDDTAVPGTDCQIG